MKAFAFIDTGMLLCTGCPWFDIWHSVRLYFVPLLLFYTCWPQLQFPFITLYNQIMNKTFKHKSLLFQQTRLNKIWRNCTSYMREIQAVLSSLKFYWYSAVTGTELGHISHFVQNNFIRLPTWAELAIYFRWHIDMDFGRAVIPFALLWGQVWSAVNLLMREANHSTLFRPKVECFR